MMEGFSQLRHSFQMSQACVKLKKKKKKNLAQGGKICPLWVASLPGQGILNYMNRESELNPSFFFKFGHDQATSFKLLPL